MTTLTYTFLGLLLAKYVVETYLSLRNWNYIQKNRHAVPEKFVNKVSLEEHHKAADYSMAKIKASFFFELFEVLVLVAWTVLGGFQVLHNVSIGLVDQPVLTGLLFFCFFALISMLLELPQSIYSTFVLEEKYGFNKTTVKTFVQDIFKGLVIGAVVGLPLISLMLWLMESTTTWWIYLWAVVALFQLIMLWAYPVLIAPLFNKFTALEEGEVKDTVQDLLKRTGFKASGLFVMDASQRSGHGNAYFTGIGKTKRIVFFDTLLKQLSPAEVVAVLAHEIGHYKKNHIKKRLIAALAMMLGAFALLGYLAQWMPFYAGHGIDTAAPHLALILFMTVSSVYTFPLTPLFSYLSRRHEYEADAYAVEHAQADDMASALVKLYKENASTLTPDPLFSAFYHSHPPAIHRVDKLYS
ncbi:MAG: M48 family metallopeptidase [Verrucomicrobiota bacterium]